MMSKIYTYSQLGSYGALGNQLWQIAGTIGKAYYGYGDAMFTDWEYRPYFSVPDSHFGEVPDGAIDLYPDYLQELAHFRLSTSYIHSIFQPSRLIENELIKLDADFTNATAVHVRRANNLGLPDHHPVCPLEYYEVALDDLPRENLWVFSDDLDWCRKQSLFSGARFGMGLPSGVNIHEFTGAKPLTTLEAAVDLHAIAKCRYHVISNSTFSWWGAYLAGSRCIKYPSRWFGPALEHINTRLMFPSYDSQWKKVEFEDSWTTN